METDGQNTEPAVSYSKTVSTPADSEPNRESRPADATGRHEVTFTLEGVRAGFLTCVPVALGVGGYGIAFGVVARQAGLSVAEATLMSATVVAGAAQLIAVELWADPIPVSAILLTTVVINLRYSLMGAALQPWFDRLSPTQAYGSLFFMADENWALTMSELRSSLLEGRHARGAFLLGSGLAVWVFWVGATIVGATAGGVIGDPDRYGLDFILTAVFVALAVELWEGRSSLVPWIGAFVTAVVANHVLPGRWYILLGGIVAAGLEVMRYDE
ncbi:AzlC family ABC transporter permease [Natronoglomus mannanivorans]|uniref:AzlC family ABC transporter permease n=1 Tax=Natronoglomus mannanivorans TaxID=2979990 RepID=UPI003CCD77C7